MTFEYKDAVLKDASLLISLVGPSFSGKTYSALRLATGIREVSGGDIAMIDTENGRGLQCADQFDFKHVDLRDDFSPDRYLQALEFCVSKGAKIVIVDSGSHCWEGKGGVLEWHERELDRMAGKDFKKRDRVNFAAWIKPKQSYTNLVNTMLQMNIHMIWCFRAKEKVEIKRGTTPIDLGFMSIAGKEMMYEFHVQALLYPGSRGVPTWESDLPGERMIIKLPTQFEPLFIEGGRSVQLCEAHGLAMAQWASGSTIKPSPRKPAVNAQDVLDEIGAAVSRAAIMEIANRYREYPWEESERIAMREMMKVRLDELKQDGEE